MARLPTIGADDNTWGTVLNDYLSVSLDSGGVIKSTAIKTVNSTSLIGSGDIAVQATLVSGTNIKTINSTSILGSGDIAVAGGTATITTTTYTGTILLDKINGRDYGQTIIITNDLIALALTGIQDGAWAQIKLIGDGVHTPVLTDFTKYDSNGLDFDNTDGTTNNCVFSRFLGTSYYIILSTEAAAPLGPYTDNFESYSVGNLAGQGSWVAVQGNIAVADVSSNKVVAPVQWNDVAAMVSGTYNNDQYAQIKYTGFGTSMIGVAVRCSASNFYAVQGPDSSGSIYLFKCINGVSTDIDYAPNVTVSVNDVLKLSVSGTTLTVTLNGSPIAGMGNASGQVTDSSISSGNPGIAGYYIESTLSYGDDFECTREN